MATVRQAVSGSVLDCAHAGSSLRGTYKIGVGSLLELLLGAVPNVGIYTRSVERAEGRNAVKAAHQRRKSPPTPG